MSNKRDKRRDKREAELGPEREIISRGERSVILSCKHELINPPVSNTVHMRPPKFYRCVKCK